MIVKEIVRTPSSALIFKPETFTEYLEAKSTSELVSIIDDALEFGIRVIHAEYREFMDCTSEHGTHAPHFLPCAPWERGSCAGNHTPV